MTVASLIDQLADESTAISVARLYALSNLERGDWTRFEAAWPRLPDDRRRAVMRHLVDIAETNFEVNFGPVFRLGLAASRTAASASASPSRNTGRRLTGCGKMRTPS